MFNRFETDAPDDAVAVTADADIDEVVEVDDIAATDEIDDSFHRKGLSS